MWFSLPQQSQREDIWPCKPLYVNKATAYSSPVPPMVVRLAKIAAGTVLAGIAAVGLLLLTMWREHATTVSLPAPTGSLAVGRTQMAWNNPISREELAMWMWYPAAPSHRPATDYLPPAWRQAFRDRQGTFMRSFFKRDSSVVRTHSQSEAPIASEHQTYPVVLLRPGGSALTADFSTLAEDLASHGYVVVGFDAPARSAVVVQSDNRTIGRAPPTTSKTPTVISPIHSSAGS